MASETITSVTIADGRVVYVNGTYRIRILASCSVPVCCG